MSKFLGALSALLVLIGLSFFLDEVSDHSYTVTLIGSNGKYEVEDKEVYEIDWDYTTTFTVVNKTGVDLYFALDAGPNASKCRVDFTPNDASKCETTVLKVVPGTPTTFTATAKDMKRRDYSWVKAGPVALPRYEGDFKVSDDPTKPPKKIDPDLEIERDPPPPLVIWSTLAAGILLGLGAWYTRRRR